MKALLLTVCAVFLYCGVFSCSMFKITLHGKTMVGNNEDAWRTGSAIWFETGREGGMGVAYVGHGDGMPQGGINEAGLAFDGFTEYPLARKEELNKRPLTSAKDFLKWIMQHCRNIDEVAEYASLYDRRSMNNALYLFVDSTGRYLTMEADTMIIGNDIKYLQSNFCPSVVQDPATVKIARYQRGRAFLNGPGDTSLQYCTRMMDVMHECRAKIGDGTEYTNIFDLQTQEICLYFYHDYRHPLHLNLNEELKKGDHKLVLSEVFPENAEYRHFLRYQTAYNNVIIQLGLYGTGALLAFSMLYWLIRFRKKMWPMFLLNGVLLYYVYVLLKDQSVYYHPLTSRLYVYIPLLFAGFAVYMGRQVYNAGSWFSKGIFIVNVVLYLILLIAGLYWHMFL